MRKILLLLLLAVALVGCQASDEFAEIQLPDAPIQIVAQPIVTGPSEAEIEARIQEEAKKLAEEMAKEKVVVANIVTVSQTQVKFNDYIDDTVDFKGGFTTADCENGLVSMSIKYFNNLQDLIENDLVDDVDDVIDDDLEDGFEDDLSDYRTDFKDIDFSKINDSIVNVTKASASILAEFNKTFNVLDDVIAYLEDAKDKLEDDDDYDEAEDEIEDAIDELKDDLDDAVKDLERELKDLMDDLKDKDSDDDYDDAKDVVDDVDALESDIDDIIDRLEDIRDDVRNAVDNYDDEDSILKGIEAAC